MSDISILVSSISVNGSNLDVQAVCCCEGVEAFASTSSTALSAAQATINAAIVDAAIAEAAVRDITVGALDRKNLFGPAAAQVL